VTDADAFARADERKPQQFRVALDTCQQFGIGELEVLQPRIDIGCPIRVQKRMQTEPIDKPLDLGGRHGLLLQIDELNRDAALFEEAFGGTARRGVFHSEDLDTRHVLLLSWRTGGASQPVAAKKALRRRGDSEPISSGHYG
jgi:hypothetical protein